MACDCVATWLLCLSGCVGADYEALDTHVRVAHVSACWRGLSQPLSHRLSAPSLCSSAQVYPFALPFSLSVFQPLSASLSLSAPQPLSLCVSHPLVISAPHPLSLSAPHVFTISESFLSVTCYLGVLHSLCRGCVGRAVEIRRARASTRREWCFSASMNTSPST